MPIVGDVLAGRYRVDAPLGVGGMASVYRARDLRLERDVAVKVLLPNLAADPVLAKRFDREARALAAAAHPNVVSVFDVEPGDPKTGREPFYVMELCDGGSLADRLSASGRLEPRELASTVAAVAGGLAELHRRGLVHRDVKPHNILFSGGRAKLADFGVATSGAATDMTALTAVGTTMGTLAYLAPELLAGAPATPASDVYALGVVAFQGLTGRLPRPAASIAEVAESRTTPAPVLSSVAPDLGTAFDQPIAASLAIDPAGRPTPVGLADALHDAAAAPVDPDAKTMSAIATRRALAHRQETARRERPAAAVLVALALLLAAVVGLASMLRNQGLAPGATPGSSLVALASASPTPSPTPSPSPTPTPQPTPTPDPAAAALSAMNDVYAAIQAADRSGGLRGKDVNDLVKRANAIRDALRRHDYGAARKAANNLLEAVDHLDRLRDSNRRQIEAAVNAVIDAIPASSD
jgi:eukaryotic-like serine/threonine-protein kinase